MNCWNTMPTSWRRRLMSTVVAVTWWPLARMVPLVGVSSRLQQRSMVLLPEPEGPITHTSSPAFTCRSTPRSTTLSP
ncbi:hypothetical protein D3C71_1716010 [compost metagenome]